MVPPVVTRQASRDAPETRSPKVPMTSRVTPILLIDLANASDNAQPPNDPSSAAASRRIAVRCNAMLGRAAFIRVFLGGMTSTIRNAPADPTDNCDAQ